MKTGLAIFRLNGSSIVRTTNHDPLGTFRWESQVKSIELYSPKSQLRSQNMYVSVLSMYFFDHTV